MNDMQFDQLMQYLNLGNILAKPSAVSGGLLHKMYRVEAETGVYAVKHMNPEIVKRPGVLKKTECAEKIAARLCDSIPTVLAIARDGWRVHCLEEDYYLVFPWVKGRTIFKPEIRAFHCEKIGKILGRIHTAEIECPEMRDEGEPLPVFPWKRYLAEAFQTQNGEQWLADYESAINDIVSWNRAANRAQTLLAGSRKVISHRDLDPKNVMWNRSIPCVIDWESAGYVNPYQEFLEALNYWATDEAGAFDETLVGALTGAYGQYMNLHCVSWELLIESSFSSMIEWLKYNVRRSLGQEIVSAEECEQGKTQVIRTIRELYEYDRNLKKSKIIFR